MASKSVSLTAQLELAVVGSIVATAIALTTVAFQTVRDNLDREARGRVRVAAQNRAAAVSRIVGGQHQRAERFIASITALCGETAPSGNVAWELGCTRAALQEFRTTEHATGAVLLAGRRRVASTGRIPPRDRAYPIGLAVLQNLTDGDPGYAMTAAYGGASIVMSFAIADFRPFFDDLSSLPDGEVFMRDASGTFLTPARYATSETPPGALLTESSHACADGAAEWRDIDYRGIDTFHGLHIVDGFATPVCVDAHLTVAEALAPADDLLAALVGRGAVFAALGLVLGLLASRWLAAPVLRLAVSARALQNGEFDRPIRIDGPSEVRQLGRSLATMARALGDMVGRERRARQEAETANRAKDEFLAVLSHELRTPLTATLGWTRLLRTGNLDQSRSQRAVDAIERSALTQSRLVNDLLDISRIIAGRLQLDRQVIALVEPITAALDELRPAAERKGIIIDTGLVNDVLVRGDADRLQQIVSNLVTNAIKFTPSGGRILVRLSSVDGHAELSVSDTGVGISPEFLPYVFDRFRQADSGPTRTHGGLGLGLAIVRHLARLHGGSVQAMSAGHDKGSTFVIELPLAESSATPTRSVAPERTSRPARLDDVMVLLVEDDEDTKNVVKAMLEDVGATVVTAASAEEGRQALLSVRPAVLVSDIAMPDEDGYTFLRSLRASEIAVPAIALTAYARREDATEAFAAGFQLHLPKPVNRAVLISAIISLAETPNDDANRKTA